VEAGGAVCCRTTRRIDRRRVTTPPSPQHATKPPLHPQSADTMNRCSLYRNNRPHQPRHSGASWLYAASKPIRRFCTPIFPYMRDACPTHAKRGHAHGRDACGHHGHFSRCSSFRPTPQWSLSHITLSTTRRSLCSRHAPLTGQHSFQALAGVCCVATPPFWRPKRRCEMLVGCRLLKGLDNENATVYNDQ
jgi:hypothetical protein